MMPTLTFSPGARGVHPRGWLPRSAPSTERRVFATFAHHEGDRRTHGRYLCVVSVYRDRTPFAHRAPRFGPQEWCVCFETAELGAPSAD